MSLLNRASKRAQRAIMRRHRRQSCAHQRPGQAMVEFVFAGTLFFLIVFGTIDFGRAIFVAAEIHNAVREGTNVGRLQPTNTTAIRAAVIDHAAVTGLTSSMVTVTCTNSCRSGDTITVSASVGFQAVTQQFLGISPFTISSSSTVDVE